MNSYINVSYMNLRLQVMSGGLEDFAENIVRSGVFCARGIEVQREARLYALGSTLHACMIYHTNVV
jgi:hypothetical protein